MCVGVGQASQPSSSERVDEHDDAQGTTVPPKRTSDRRVAPRSRKRRDVPRPDPATGAGSREIGEAAAPDRGRRRSGARARGVRCGQVPSMPASRRAKILYKIAQLIGERADELILTEVRDNGKTIATARASSAQSWTAFEFYAGAATKNYGATRRTAPIATYLANTVSRSRVGVVAAIVSVEFPAAARLLEGRAGTRGPGCTVVLKPAPSTPLTALALGTHRPEAGLPEGGSTCSRARRRELGQALVEPSARP